MNTELYPLNMLPIGQKARVGRLEADGALRRRMQDLGLIQGTMVEAVQKSPSGDPVAYAVRGALIALRAEDAGRILIGQPA